MTAIIFQDSELDPGNVGDNNLRKQHKKSLFDLRITNWAEQS